MSASAEAAIGVFDSGVGGLTVLRKLIEKFPNENFLYLGDNAHLPYGTKSPEIIKRYTETALQFLADQQVKALVVACNSASTQILDKSFAGLPVETVIEPGAQMALNASHSRGCRIGVLGTRATVSSGIYERTIRQLSPNSEIQVFSQSAPLFVPLAEEGWTDDPITNLIVYRYVAPLLAQQIDTLVLGCTHYPILKSSIQKVAGPQIELIESGAAVAEKLAQLMHAEKIPQSLQQTKGIVKLMITDPDSNFKGMAVHLLGGSQFDSIELVSL